MQIIIFGILPSYNETSSLVCMYSLSHLFLKYQLKFILLFCFFHCLLVVLVQMISVSFSRTYPKGWSHLLRFILSRLFLIFGSFFQGWVLFEDLLRFFLGKLWKEDCYFWWHLPRCFAWGTSVPSWEHLRYSRQQEWISFFGGLLFDTESS